MSLFLDDYNNRFINGFLFSLPIIYQVPGNIIKNYFGEYAYNNMLMIDILIILIIGIAFIII